MKLGLLITTYNRPQYLRQCLESILRSTAIKRDDVEILIVDDGSTNSETLELINPDWASTIKKPRAGIKDSLLKGYNYFFNDYNDVGLVINLDGDAIVRNDFLEILLSLKKRFNECIVSGFNTTVKNRNPIIAEHDLFYEKKYASGINMVINQKQYLEWVKPALLKPNCNWDYETSLASERAGFPVIVSRPSVIQHIGIEESSMGHISGSEPPDVAEDFVLEEEPFAKMAAENAEQFKEILKAEGPYMKFPCNKLQLPNVTLFGIAYNDPVGLKRAAAISQQDIQFGAVVMITEKLFEGRIGYSHFCMKELNRYIKTDYVLRIEPDGYVQNAAAWNPDWLNYDLIGSPWLWYQDGFNVGNGVSLRSKRLHDILANDDSIIPTNDHIIKEHEEDHNICRIYRPYLEKQYGIKFAPVEEAKKFGIEAWRSDDDTYSGQFLFHGYKVKGLPFPPLPKVK